MGSPGIRLVEGTEEGKAHTPAVSLLLAYAGVAPIVAGAIASWLLDRGTITRLTIVWSGALLCFLSGVRRGLAFRQPDGVTVVELATVLAVFGLGVGALLLPWHVPALLLLLAGYAGIGVADVRAARREEAPIYFARLRSPQMTIAVAALVILLARCV